MTELHLQKRQAQYIVGVNGQNFLMDRISNNLISNNHEEADTLIVRTFEQIKSINCNVILYATDTDVYFLLLKHCKVILCYIQPLHFMHTWFSQY